MREDSVGLGACPGFSLWQGDGSKRMFLFHFPLTPEKQSKTSHLELAKLADLADILVT